MKYNSVWNFQGAIERGDLHVFFPRENHIKNKSKLFIDLLNK